jgi:chromosome segregation ATPase
MKQGGSSAAVLSAVGDSPELAFAGPSPHQEEVDSRLNAMRDELVVLRRQQEELERQKGELEDLRRKQEEYARGRTEMIEKITRSLVTLEREQIESQRVAELSSKTREAFTQYLDKIQAINDQEWTGENVRTELSHALGLIENARLEYNRACARLDCMNPSQATATGVSGPVAAAAKPVLDWDEMLRYLCLGAAASSPLIVAGTIWLLMLMGAR